MAHQNTNNLPKHSTKCLLCTIIENFRESNNILTRNRNSIKNRILSNIRHWRCQFNYFTLIKTSYILIQKINFQLFNLNISAKLKPPYHKKVILMKKLNRNNSLI